jgi:hypothetical protein
MSVFNLEQKRFLASPGPPRALCTGRCPNVMTVGVENYGLISSSSAQIPMSICAS